MTHTTLRMPTADRLGVIIARLWRKRGFRAASIATDRAADRMGWGQDHVLFVRMLSIMAREITPPTVRRKAP